MRLFLKNLLFTVIVPGTVAVIVPIWMAGGCAALRATPRGPGPLLAAPLLLAGAAIYLGCVWDFATKGRGTPAPIDAPKRLVVAGLYRYVRNPMYLGVLSLIGGWALFFRSWVIFLYGCALGLAFHLFVIFYEEPHLRAVFGSSYERYCRAVRRWIPGRRYEPAG